MPLLAENIIVPLVKKDLAVPSGLTRDDTFSGLYLNGCRSVDTTGGATGGDTEHTHITSLTHTHTYTINAYTGSATTDNIGVANSASPSHTHTGTFAAASPTVSNEANDLEYFEVVFCKSDGVLSVIPEGCAFFAESPIISTHLIADGKDGTTNLIDKYLKGAGILELAGKTGGSNTHRHTINHNHPNSTSGTGTAIPTQGARGSGVSPATHTHTAQTNDVLTLYSEYANNEPVYRSLIPYYSFGGALVTDMILIWKGLKADIPTDWAEVEGQRDYFLKCASSVETGGANSHTHTSSHSHVAIQAGTSARGTLVNLAGSVQITPEVHTHSSFTVTASDGALSDSATTPKFIKVFFIKYTEPPVAAGAKWFNTWRTA
jgi:hypothetical protein